MPNTVIVIILIGFTTGGEVLAWMYFNITTVVRYYILFAPILGY